MHSGGIVSLAFERGVRSSLRKDSPSIDIASKVSPATFNSRVWQSSKECLVYVDSDCRKDKFRAMADIAAAKELEAEMEVRNSLVLRLS